MRSPIVGCALLGLAAGVAAGTAETARLSWFVAGSHVPPELVIYAAVIDGLSLAVIGAVVGTVWALVGRRHRGRASSNRISGAPVFSRRMLFGLTGAAAASAVLLSIGLDIRRRRPALSNGGATSASAGWARETGGPPNVVFVTIDTLRADQLSSYGNPSVKTPALDAVAASGVRFLQHLIQEPSTNPSHASMFIGMYPSSSGVRIHMVDKLPGRVETLAGLLAAAGYQTAGLYSWMSLDPQYSGLERGFQTYRNVSIPPAGIMGNPLVKEAMARYRVAEQYLALPQIANELVPVKSNVESTAKGRADLTTDAAIAQLREFSSEPFFLWVHYFDAHYPYEPPAGYGRLYDSDYHGTVDGSMRIVDAVQSGQLKLAGPDLQRVLSLYQAEITFTDVQFARLLQAIDQLDTADRTVLFVSGDHGESFGEHTELDVDGNFFHPHSLYNTEEQVPLLVRYPGRLRGGGVIDAPTQAIDLFPTVLELAGVNVPAQSEGRSLLRLLDGTDNAADRAAYASMPDYTFTSITTAGWKLIQNNASGLRRLFDLANDPGELHDQLGTRPEIGTELASKLHQWMKEVRIA